ncbi:MAG: response regulator [Deltaproteobacteria bacterium]|nr:response regulator [Deltaproteobacteria bacterium]
MDGDGTLNLLLVEDDEVDVITVRRAFAAAKLPTQVTVARNGLEALELLRSGAFPPGRRLVLLDINMPKMTGIELLREVRADPALSALTVIVMTTSNDDRDRVEAFRLNVAGYIVKPVTYQAFEKAMAMISAYWRLMELP